MSLTRKDIDEIMALLENSRFDWLHIEMDGLKLELARSGAAPRAPASPPVATPVRPEPVEGRSRAASQTLAPSREGLVEVKSPLLGIFYAAPKPGERAFVGPGDRVEADSVIGIIEVMKLMNSARAGVAGEIVEILATNGEMVEYGEVLMLVRPD